MRRGMSETCQQYLLTGVEMLVDFLKNKDLEWI